MGWWTSVVDSAKFVYRGLGTLSSEVSNGAKWLWNNAPLSKFATTVFTYGANTFFQGMEQIMALQKAVPALIKHPATRQIVDEVAYLVAYDVAPMLALNAANNRVQDYFREGQPDDTSWLAPYTLFLSGLALVNYGVTAYTWRQGAQASARMVVIAINAPSAFSSNKDIIPKKSFCEDLKCSIPRKLKGTGREQVILAANDALVWAISCIPGIGAKASWFVRVICNGRYITRVVTPERCEDHKAMMQESVLALGLSYELSCALMDLLLEYTIGLPPFLYHRILKQVLLLIHINNATYMNVPLIKPEEATIRFDLSNRFEWISRFVANVIYAGLAKRIPIDFKRPEDEPPLIPLSPTLQLGTEVLRSDIPKEESSPVVEPVVQLVGSPDLSVQSVKSQILEAHGTASKKPEELLFSPKRFNELLKDFANMVKPWVLPPMLQSARDFINDPIVFNHWPALREGGIATIDAIKTYGQSNATATLAWAPKGVAAVLYWTVGIPKFATRVVLMLTNEKDFWDLANALKAWFERHDIKFEVKLADEPQLALLDGTKKIELPPSMKDSSPVLPAEELITQRQTSAPLIPAEDLLSTRNLLILDDPDDLLPTRTKSISDKPKDLLSMGTKLIADEPKDSLLTRNELILDSPEDLLSTRRRKHIPKSNQVDVNEVKKTIAYTSAASNPESLFTTRKRKTNGIPPPSTELTEHVL